VWLLASCNINLNFNNNQDIHYRAKAQSKAKALKSQALLNTPKNGFNWFAILDTCHKWSSYSPVCSYIWERAIHATNARNTLVSAMRKLSRNKLRWTNFCTINIQVRKNLHNREYCGITNYWSWSWPTCETCTNRGTHLIKEKWPRYHWLAEISWTPRWILCGDQWYLGPAYWILFLQLNGSTKTTVRPTSWVCIDLVIATQC